MLRNSFFRTVIVCLNLALALAATPVFAEDVEETFQGEPDSSALSPHVVFPDLGTIPWPLDCSQWPETSPVTPDDGYLASVFGHREHGGGADFHRGIDLRCNVNGKTCCQRSNETIYCDKTTCDGDDEELGAPILSLFDGIVHTANSGDNNNLVIETTLTGGDEIQIGDETCDTIYVWYQHMRSPYAEAWQSTDPTDTDTYNVSRGDVLGYQGNSGANSVHLHLSTRVCGNSRADGDQDEPLDPEVNPFQLIGSDDNTAPAINSMTTEFAGTDLVVTVEIETEDPDFDKLEITVYDADQDQSTVRRLGYNSRFGIDVLSGNIDTYLLEPDEDSEIISLLEPDPPTATSGLTLEATFENLNLASDTDSYVQVKVADVWGNTSIEQLYLFGDAEIGDFVWDDVNGDGIQDAGEPGLAGVAVELYSPISGLVASTATDAQGNYSFDGLVAGDYYLSFQAPAGYGATVQVQDPSFDNVDSNVNRQTLETAVFPVTTNALDLSIDAGFTSACFDVTLVGRNSEWKTSGSHATDWNTLSFNDGGWSELQGALGWSNGRVYKTIPSSGITAYFRLEFDVEDVTLFDTLDLELLRDDGAVVYLNGVELMRSNMPAGAIDENTRASGFGEATVTANVPATSMRTGPNVLAVEVHNGSPTSDMVFDLAMRSKVCRSCLTETFLSADAGTYIREPNTGANANNYGDDEAIEVDGDDDKTDSSGKEKNALISWDLTGLPTNADVLHAELMVEVTNKSSSDFPIFALVREWDESSTTWDDASDSPLVPWEAGGAHGASDRGTTPLGLVSLNQTGAKIVELNASGRAQVNDWIDGTADNYGLFIYGEVDETDGLDFESGDDGTTAPRLRLIYASACGN